MYIVFNDICIDLEKAPEFISEDKILFYQQEEAIPALESGFLLTLDDGTTISYEDFNVIEENNDEIIVFSADDTEKSVFYLFDENNFVVSYTVTTEEVINVPNSIFIRRGKGSLNDCGPDEIFDEEMLPKMKIEDGEIVLITEEDKIFLKEQKFQKSKINKIKNFSEICANNVTNGIDYNGEHFSYELSDQNNLYNSVQLSLSTGGLSIPYHADGKECRLFSNEELIAIYAAQEQNLTHNITYNNQMKHYIEDRVTTQEELDSIYYGTELVDEYLDNYNLMMLQAQNILQAFLGNLSPIGE